MKTSTKNVCLLAATFILALFISSCSKNNENYVQSYVQMVNASPDAGAVNLYVTNNLKITGATYANPSGYVTTTLGDNQTVEVKSASGTSLATTTSNFDADIHYSIYLAGQVSANNLSAIAVRDDMTAPSSGNAKIRFVNAASISPAVDLSANGTVVFTAQSYKGISSYAEKPAGSYVFKLNLTGTATALVTTPSITLQAGKIYTIYSKNLVVSGNTVMDAAVIANN